MGSRPMAGIVWGYAWPGHAEGALDEVRDSWGETGCSDWAGAIARRRGATNPIDDYREPDDLGYRDSQRHFDAWANDHRAERDAWRAAVKAVEDEFGCDIGDYGSEDSYSPYVYVKASSLYADWEDAEEIDPARFEVPPEWPVKLAAFCDAVGIEPPPGGPRWWIVVSYR